MANSGKHGQRTTKKGGGTSSPPARRLPPSRIFIEVNPRRCTGCGECVDICPVAVYDLRGGKACPIDKQTCIGCQACAEVCPQNAIRVKRARQK